MYAHEGQERKGRTFQKARSRELSIIYQLRKKKQRGLIFVLGKETARNGQKTGNGLSKSAEEKGSFLTRLEEKTEIIYYL